ncbi:Transcriptional activatory protein BadR [Paenibacillus plantiphilus]|uniref:Transcriptional activatory protein BadR n=1 Tax=Paenibacillus plantiphilus TaxID=2905650 RepID=A0ABM9C1E0_9BACL|nr:MarR family winged helix-turn-helix transcriptional regulator [Paenibacillus plantiphilus]CAH1199301.1 Transcriptional activatory protein BadR [Paenibacillus plantiphilus]
MDQLQREIVLNVYRCSNLLERVGRGLVNEVGLCSVQQWFILGVLYRQGELSLKDLTNNLLVTKQNITGMVQRLKQGGYLSAWEDPADRRITRVGLTDLGRQVFEELFHSSSASNEDTFSSFSREEVEQLSELMAKLVNVLQLQSEREKELRNGQE